MQIYDFIHATPQASALTSISHTRQLKFDYRVEDLSEETAKCTLMFAFSSSAPINLCIHDALSQNN
jgi:hypothetical protein